MKKTVVIEGMMCCNCKRHVEEALEKLGLTFTVSLEDGKAFIENCEISDEAITSAIDEAGYDVVEIING